MRAWAELEIALDRRDDAYSVDLRFSQPNDDTDIMLLQKLALTPFDFEGLQKHGHDPVAYGKLLGQNLFAERVVYDRFIKARDVAFSNDVPLRVRLFIHPNAPELHSLRWETLRDPHDNSWLFTNQNVLFSRYLSTLSWRRVRLRAKSDLRALVVIANPADIGQWRVGGQALTPVDVAGELARSKAALGSIKVTELASGGTATLQQLSEHLADDYDILYLVCHGATDKGQPWLYLENETGNVAVVPGSKLVTRLQDLPQAPRLVVLASCQSAGTGLAAGEPSSLDQGALAALGPRLIEAGVPAVVAMQGSVTMQTVETFMPLFFAELVKHGPVDQAMAAARGGVRERPDAWMPVLFMRFKSGHISYTRGFSAEQDGKVFTKWRSVLNNIDRERCTAILGPGVSEVVLGPERDLAQQWAVRVAFPFGERNAERLAQVAQYVSTMEDASLIRTDFTRQLLQRSIVQRFKDPREGSQTGPVAEMVAQAERLVREPPRGDALFVRAEQVIAEAGRLAREQRALEPHAVLASLPFRIYVTASQDNLLFEALKAAGKQPKRDYCRWNMDLEGLDPLLDYNEKDWPSRERPLVFHLFGHLGQPESLVLTEDDYLDYLVGITKYREAIPDAVGRALVSSALLFLGFRVDDWSFRALFRGVLRRQEGRALREGFAHVAAQISPDGDETLDPEGVRRYLEEYFQKASINAYWGSVEEFVQELHKSATDSGATAV